MVIVPKTVFRYKGDMLDLSWSFKLLFLLTHMHDSVYIRFLAILMLGFVAKMNVAYNNFAVIDFEISGDKSKIGEIIDEYNNIPVYYNGKFSNVSGRNMTDDGYNLGLKYQCIEFVKRYYYTIYDHKMPDAYGNAKDLFNHKIKDGKLNPERDLIQYTNGSKVRPKEGDILIFGSSQNNKFGHAGIVCYSKGKVIEIIQQNVGLYSRSSYSLVYHQGRYYVSDKSILGWLRK